MSGILGIFNRNGNPVKKKIAEDMFETMSYLGSDEHDLWIDGPVALAHAMLWNTPESKYEHLPLYQDEYVLTMDARIDNRDELAKELELPDRPMSEIGDSEFVLAAYRKWGEECSKHLLGDFAFVIWDRKRQQLFCSRDYIGVKQFYYYLDNEKFVFSNDIKVLLACSEIEILYDDDAIAKYLRPDFNVEQDFTFYENVHKLLPARSITVRRDEKKETIYWKAEECPKIRYENIDQYLDSARKLLEKAVYVRIRSAYPVASHLSGGLDSSSIAVLASRKLAESGQSLTGFNWIPALDGSDISNYYEWNNSKKIALLENIEHQAIGLSEEDIFDIYKTLNVMHGDTLHFWYESQIQKYANNKNMRVILSGTGGDQFISHKGLIPKVRISWKKRFKKVHRTLVSESLGSRDLILKYIQKFYSFIVYRAMPDWLLCIYNGSYCSYRVPKYMQPTIAKKIKKLQANIWQTNNMNIRNSMLSNVSNGSIQARLESWDISGKSNKIEYRYPLLDRKLVEFALGIPEDLFYHNGQERFLFRHIIEKLLPQEVIWFDTKYEPKRVKNYIETTQKSQKLWRNLYNFEDKNCKYFKLDELFREIDMCKSENHGIIAYIASSILIIESLKKGKE